MPTIVYLDGNFCAPADAKVSLFDRGYLLGDSIFETMRAYGSVPFRLGQHLDRLGMASDALGIVPKERVDQIAELTAEAIHQSGETDASIRITISRGEGPPGVSTEDCDRPVLSIVVRPIVGYPESAYRNGIRTKVVGPCRIPAKCIDPSFKCGNYLPSTLARRELEREGMIEGVQLGVDQQVVGGTVSNVFLVCGHRLQTPDLASGCLPGVTRAAVLEVAAESGLEPVEQKIEPWELAAADEIFFTNSIMECLPVAAIDAHVFAETPGPATLAVHKALRTLIENETAFRKDSV